MMEKKSRWINVNAPHLDHIHYLHRTIHARDGVWAWHTIYRSPTVSSLPPHIESTHSSPFIYLSYFSILASTEPSKKFPFAFFAVASCLLLSACCEHCNTLFLEALSIFPYRKLIDSRLCVTQSRMKRGERKEDGKSCFRLKYSCNISFMIFIYQFYICRNQRQLQESHDT